ncbi:MAG: GNAT family N-acetyltransferase [Acidimicrobiales bacterium]
MTIRALTAADRAALAGFTCARLGEAWAEAVQETIRHDLADQLAAATVSAVGLFDEDGVLCGVAAWRIYDVMPPVLCRSDIVAVAVRQQRKGYGRALKQAVIDEARAAGAVAVASIVHRNNTAMLALNRRLGATIEYNPEDPENCRCAIGPLQG